MGSPLAHQQQPPSPPPEEFNKDTVAELLHGLGRQILDQMQGMERRLNQRIDGIAAGINERISTMETAIDTCFNNMEAAINGRIDKLESFATNTNARAKNDRAYEQGVDYTPLVQADGNEILNFPRTFRAVNSLTDQRVSTLLEALGIDIGDGWDLWKKRSAFLGAIGVLQSPAA
ncbi:hypothetical protein FGADI_5409 [Fusarium gaditjirri]|uniref:Uncharacterized protein n=1 Tax=Fusarium gaditjirri TaxID=282569 RepID=A0A8H4WYA2_9HYPO|nr:hypothetical protein FGADI_5409 [Fusarium gaditjirri]